MTVARRVACRFLPAIALALGVLPGATGPVAATSGPAAAADERTAERERLVAQLRRELDSRLGDRIAERYRRRTLKAIAAVPRHGMVPARERGRAYANRPLPIGHGQTISQPSIVAFMTALLEPDPGDRVLEIGTGSGYQAAVLAEIVESVYSIEIIEALGEQAAPRLERLGYTGVRTRIGDGYYGWEEAAPFDAIIVTAAASHIPPPLVRQLAPGGRMVVPVGGGYSTQFLTLVTRQADGEVRSEQLLPVRFVPLTGGPRQGRP